MSPPLPRQGLLAAGNFIVDHTHRIDAFPAEGTLATVWESHTNNGGGPYNVLIDLARLDATFPLHALGLIGSDGNGQWIRDNLQASGIDTSLLAISDVPTSFTEVISSAASGQRTFFHYRGANAQLDTTHFDFTDCSSRFFYLGYLLLLDQLDQPDPTFGTRAGRVLDAARKAGLFTITDCVSLQGGRFDSIVCPTLPHVDGCILNDYEAEQCTSIPLCDHSKRTLQSLHEAAQAILAIGVRQWVVIHFPEGAYALNREGHTFTTQSLHVPKEQVLGTNGAGDAFAAGLIYALHQGENLDYALDLGCRVAAASLRHPSASLGIISLEETWEWTEKLSRLTW